MSYFLQSYKNFDIGPCWVCPDVNRRITLDNISKQCICLEVAGMGPMGRSVGLALLHRWALCLSGE